jgi:hypothetical protein
MFFRLRRAARFWQARSDFARILKTPPVQSRDDGAIIFTQLQHKDVLMYLVAAKSFAHHSGYGRFVVLDDGTLTQRDRALMGHHLPGIEFRAVKDVRYGGLPVGGTWERLITITDLAETDYVIQLDADTVTCGTVDDVRRCVRESKSFTIMAGHTAKMLPIATIAALANTVHKDHHVQIAAEGMLGELDASVGTRYGCGSSAFAGFCPDPDRRAVLERFSARMEELLGARWREWGTEQVSSNFLVAHDPEGELLPYRGYRNFGGEKLTAECAFVHFFGTFRFDEGMYRRMSRETAALLNGKRAAQPDRWPQPAWASKPAEQSPA